jgi:hypothetical protein
MRTMILGLAAAAALVFACSSGSGESGAQEPAGTGEPAISDEEAQRRAAAEKLDRYQAAACERVCPRLTECAEQSARASDPSALEGVPIDELRARHTQECLAECNENKLSLRQVEIYYECPEQHDTCPALVECLEQAENR